MLGVDSSQLLIGAAFGAIGTAALFLLFAWVMRHFKIVLLVSAIVGAASLLKLAW